MPKKMYKRKSNDGHMPGMPPKNMPMKKMPKKPTRGPSGWPKKK